MTTQDQVLEFLKHTLLPEVQEISARLLVVEGRLDQIDKRFEQVDVRFDCVDKRFDKIERDIRELHEDLREVRSYVFVSKVGPPAGYQVRERPDEA
jgi:septation ring formation regulator EzrA